MLLRAAAPRRQPVPGRCPKRDGTRHITAGSGRYSRHGTPHLLLCPAPVSVLAATACERTTVRRHPRPAHQRPRHPGSDGGAVAGSGGPPRQQRTTGAAPALPRQHRLRRRHGAQPADDAPVGGSAGATGGHGQGRRLPALQARCTAGARRWLWSSATFPRRSWPSPTPRHWKPMPLPSRCSACTSSMRACTASRAVLTGAWPRSSRPSNWPSACAIPPITSLRSANCSSSTAISACTTAPKPPGRRPMHWPSSWATAG